MTKPIIPNAALEQHLIALGKTGSGKSSKLRVLVEGLLAREEPFCGIDPKGDWWGLKSSANGKSAGFPIVIFGGEHADVPLNPHAGAAVAELIFTGNRPSLIDMRGWMPHERTQFFIDFASTVFKITRGHRYLLIDEVHNFAPKGKVLSPEAGQMLHWANRLASEGRGLGLTLLAASQRPQKVHNDFLTSCETLVACRVIHKADRDAMKDWIDGCADPDKGNEVLSQLASMKRDEAWVWSPEIEFGPKRIAFPMFETFDSFKPQAGKARRRLRGWASVDLDDVKAKLADVVKEAEANDPKKLRAELATAKAKIAQLEKRPAATAQPDRKAIADAEAQGYARGKLEGIEAVRGLAVPWGGLEKAVAGMGRALKETCAAVAKTTRQRHEAAAPQAPQRHETPAPAAPSAAPRRPVPPPPAGTGTVDGSGARRRIMIALAQNPGGLHQRKVSILSSIKRGGSTWRGAMAGLRKDGHVDESGEHMRLNDAGVAALGSYDPLPTGDALRQHWRAQMGNATRLAVFDAIVGAYPNSIPSADVAAAAGVELGGSTWRGHMAYLRGLELVTGKQDLKASDDLFE